MLSWAAVLPADAFELKEYKAAVEAQGPGGRRWFLRPGSEAAQACRCFLQALRLS